jgi:hypothetical protein
VSTTSHEDPSVGMGTMNSVTEILDIYAVLDKDRKESLIGYSGRLVEEQHAEQRAAATA